MTKNQGFSRRHFLKLGGAGLLLPLAGCASDPSGGVRPFRMGMIADLHHGLEPTARRRLSEFVEGARFSGLDCITQLGDFNYGKPESLECMDIWNRFEGNKYHVLGNHDMDFYNKEHMVEFWSMPGRYYSFDCNGYHFVVLDRNNLKTTDGYVHYAHGNFYVDSKMRGHADPEQLEWLATDLKATRLPAVVFMHQGLGMQNEAYPPGDARGAVEAVFEQANRDAGTQRVAAVFCGHHHIDRYNRKNGIHYVWINSASYYWVGAKYGKMAPYRDVLFAVVTFHPKGLIEIKGCSSIFEPPTPQDRDYPDADKLTPYISDRRLDLA